MDTNRECLIGDDVRCSCNGYNLDKLIQPRILVLLGTRYKELHGYRIIELLNERKFTEVPADSTGIYRTLKLMEDRNLLASEWELNDSGPARKIYRITETGRDCLENWIRTLQDYQSSITEILDLYKG